MTMLKRYCVLVLALCVMTSVNQSKAEESELYRLFSLNDLKEKPERTYACGKGRHLVIGQSKFTGFINTEEDLKEAISRCPEIVKPFLESVDIKKEAAFIGSSEHRGSGSVTFDMEAKVKDKVLTFGVTEHCPQEMTADLRYTSMYFVVKVSRKLDKIQYGGRTHLLNQAALTGVKFLQTLDQFAGKTDEEIRNTERAYISGDHIKPYEVINFCAIDKLSSLTLSSIELDTDELLAVLTKKSLKELFLRKCTLADYEGDIKNSSIESIHFHVVKLSEKTFESLMSMPKLKEVKLVSWDGYTGVSTRLGGKGSEISHEKIFSALCGIQGLEKLVVDDQTGSEIAPLIGRLKKLKVLDIEIAGKSEMTVLDQIAKLTDLEYLSLEFNVPMTTEMVEKISGLSRIKTLVLNSGFHNALEKQALQAIAKMKNIENLGLGYFKIDLAGFKALAGLPLKRLDLRSNRYLDNRCVKLIAESFPDMRTINMRYCSKVTDASLPALAKMKNLKIVNIFSSGISKDQFQMACPDVKTSGSRAPFMGDPLE